MRGIFGAEGQSLRASGERLAMMDSHADKGRVPTGMSASKGRYPKRAAANLSQVASLGTEPRRANKKIFKRSGWE